MNFLRHSFRSATSFLLLFSVGATLSIALAGQDVEGPPPPARFDTVSVRLVPNVDVNGSIHSAGAVDPGLWRAHQAVLVWVIKAAYGINFSDSLDDQLILGTPDWVDNTEFNIEARIPPHARRAQIPLMLQAMLAERFHLKTHWGARPMQAVAMSVAPGGQKLTRDTACESPNLAPRVLGVPMELPLGAAQGISDCGAAASSLNGEVVTTRFHGYTMPQLAAFIGRNQIVVDHTGLTGAYDFTLSYASVSIRGVPRGQWTAIDEKNLRERIVAYRKQLGLTIDLMREAKLPVPVLVIDHIEKPTSN